MDFYLFENMDVLIFLWNSIAVNFILAYNFFFVIVVIFATLRNYSPPMTYQRIFPRHRLRRHNALTSRHKTPSAGPKCLIQDPPVLDLGQIDDAIRLDFDIISIRLCEKHDLVLLADEVYQFNLHNPDTHPFHSFKKVVRSINSPISLISFHSISKGVKGECGRRGGYFECTNITDEVRAILYKMVSVGLCPPLSGQIGVDCMVRPPKEGEASYPQYKAETESIHAALAQRTKLMAARLNALPGVSCVNSPGALYLYPRLELPDGAVVAARKLGKEPDTLYALELLDDTGICVVPGSGFGQKDGEHHYRLTCLCPGVEEYVQALETFHRKFVAKYGGL